MLQPTCRHCAAGVQGCFRGVGIYLLGTLLQVCRLFERCQKLSAGHCVAGMQLFKPCRNLSASTVF